MDRQDDKIHHLTRTPELTGRRAFLATGAIGLATLVLSPVLRRITFAAAKHRYKLAPESLLSADIRRAPDEVREAYPFPLANRKTLPSIPFYSGSGDQGPTTKAPCSFQD